MKLYTDKITVPEGRDITPEDFPPFSRREFIESLSQEQRRQLLEALAGFQQAGMLTDDCTVTLDDRLPQSLVCWPAASPYDDDGS